MVFIDFYYNHFSSAHIPLYRTPATTMAMITAVGIRVIVNSWRRFNPSAGESSNGWLVVPKIQQNVMCKLY